MHFNHHLRLTGPQVLRTYLDWFNMDLRRHMYFESYLESQEQHLAAEDSQKLVPFIPVLDAGFEVWFKKVNFQSS